MRFAVAVLFFLGASGFRVKPKRRVQSTPGQGDGVFPYAAPGTAEPGLQNPRGGPCFPGVRSAAVKMQWFGQEADLATTITGVIGFRHPWMDFKLVDLKNSNLNYHYTCDSEVPNRPRGSPKISLHAWQGYAAAMENMDLGFNNLMHKLANIGLPASYNHVRNAAHAIAQQFGWALIGSAVDPGGFAYVGEQVSHLFQDPSSKECMLTFQGSSSVQDWTANFNIDKVSFCGYAPAGARMASDEHPTTLMAGQSLVHEGFKDALMHMVNSSDWQSDVRPKLSSCSKVYVTGHSLGAVQAELFTACAQMAPQQGQNGWDDYKHIGWTQR